MTDDVKKQPHYSQHAMEPITFLRANMKTLNFLQSNIIKYVCRFNQKDGRRDLEKAADYLRMLVEEWDHAANQSEDYKFPSHEAEVSAFESWQRDFDAENPFLKKDVVEELNAAIEHNKAEQRRMMGLENTETRCAECLGQFGHYSYCSVNYGPKKWTKDIHPESEPCAPKYVEPLSYKNFCLECGRPNGQHTQECSTLVPPSVIPIPTVPTGVGKGYTLMTVGGKFYESSYWDHKEYVVLTSDYPCTWWSTFEQAKTVWERRQPALAKFSVVSEEYVTKVLQEGK